MVLVSVAVLLRRVCLQRDSGFADPVFCIVKAKAIKQCEILVQGQLDAKKDAKNAKHEGLRAREDRRRGREETQESRTSETEK